MSLLPDGQQNNIEVSWEDQQKINKFSTLIQRKDLVSADLKQLETEKEYINDILQDVEMLELEDDDEDEEKEDENESPNKVSKEHTKIQYKIGDTFVFMGYEEATERANKDLSKLELQIDAKQKQLQAFNSELSSLKTLLYAKFGDNINLERD